MRSDLDPLGGPDRYLTPARRDTKAPRRLFGVALFAGAVIGVWLSDLEWVSRFQWTPSTPASALSIPPYAQGYLPPDEGADAAAEAEAGELLSPLEVQKLQSALAMRGFRPGPIDGIAGRQTLAALNAYRTSLDLLEVRILTRAAAIDLLP